LQEVHVFEHVTCL